MIKSMTGFGYGEGEVGGVRVVVEIRSVNHRYGTVYLKIPETLRNWEERIKEVVKRRFPRGRIDLNIKIDSLELNEGIPRIDRERARFYLKELKELRGDLGLKGKVTLDMVLSFRDLITTAPAQGGFEGGWEGLSSILDKALMDLEGMKLREGEELSRDLLGRLERVRALLTNIQHHSEGVIENYKRRLRERVKELSNLVEISEDRLAQEVAFLAEKSDIQEEMVRLGSHLTKFESMLGEEQPVGHKLDFIIQEMNREANTIGGKAGDAQISHWVVEIKGELGALREQVQNIE